MSDGKKIPVIITIPNFEQFSLYLAKSLFNYSAIIFSQRETTFL